MPKLEPLKPLEGRLTEEEVEKKLEHSREFLKELDEYEKKDKDIKFTVKGIYKNWNYLIVKNYVEHPGYDPVA